MWRLGGGVGAGIISRFGWAWRILLPWRWVRAGSWQEASVPTHMASPQLPELPGSWPLSLTVRLDPKVMKPSTSQLLLRSSFFKTVFLQLCNTDMRSHLPFDPFLRGQHEAYSHCGATTTVTHPRTFSFGKTHTLDPLNKHQLPTSASPRPWQPPCYFLSPRLWLSQVPHINGIIQHLSFYACLISLSITCSWFAYVGWCVRISFLFKAE